MSVFKAFYDEWTAQSVTSAVPLVRDLSDEEQGVPRAELSITEEVTARDTSTRALETHYVTMLVVHSDPTALDTIHLHVKDHYENLPEYRSLGGWDRLDSVDRLESEMYQEPSGEQGNHLFTSYNRFLVRVSHQR